VGRSILSFDTNFSNTHALANHKTYYTNNNGNRNRMPPRSLLDLVDSDIHSRKELLQRISSISLFKAPASWNMASGGLPRSWKELNDIEGTTYCVRSKLASGVPMLMNTVSESAVITMKTWGSRKYIQKKKTLKIRKLIRIIFGKSKAKSS
ncbi:MAG: hypothetical protein ACI90V_005478, partial [Bacillariaceae sp.]|jgi:hypothetical protein